MKDIERINNQQERRGGIRYKMGSAKSRYKAITNKPLMGFCSYTRNYVPVSG